MTIKDKSYSIAKASNGYVLTVAWKEMADENKTFDYNYASETLIFSDWKDVAKWVTDNNLS